MVGCQTDVMRENTNKWLNFFVKSNSLFFKALHDSSFCFEPASQLLFQFPYVSFHFVNQSKGAWFSQTVVWLICKLILCRTLQLLYYFMKCGSLLIISTLKLKVIHFRPTTLCSLDISIKHFIVFSFYEYMFFSPL